MQDDGDTQKLARLRDLVEQAKEWATQARKGIEHTSATATQAHQQATSARERARTAKRRELVAHARAIQLYEQAAERQARLGHPDRAATARQHAAHARELQELPLPSRRRRKVDRSDRMGRAVAGMVLGGPDGTAWSWWCMPTGGNGPDRDVAS